MADENDDVPSNGEAGGNVRTPPYISFATFLTFLKALKVDGLPPQIDKSVLSKLSGGVQGQMKLGLRSLGLMDGDKPTAEMQRLVDAYDTPEFNSVLLERLKATYPYVFALDLMTATPTMLADAFKVTGAREDVSRKCRTFFLHAAKQAGVPMGNRILTGSVPRSPSTGAKRKPKAKPKDEQQEQNPNANQHNKTDSDNGVLDKLLSKFPEFDPTWPDDIKKQWFTGFEQFMKGAKAK